jgi:hypothetical protein
MGTIGPLTHMQAERRAFWILRTVPVPLASLLAAKARAVGDSSFGGIAAVIFAVMSVSVPHDVGRRAARGRACWSSWRGGHELRRGGDGQRRRGLSDETPRRSDRRRSTRTWGRRPLQRAAGRDAAMCVAGLLL